MRSPALTQLGTLNQLDNEAPVLFMTPPHRLPLGVQAD